MDSDTKKQEGKGRLLYAIGVPIAIIGGLVVFFSGYGSQWDWWHFRTGFQMIPWGTGVSVFGGLLVIIAFYRNPERHRKETLAGILALIISTLSMINIAYWAFEVSKGYPMIHDITTDTSNPPEFVAIVPLRKEAPNQTAYNFEETPHLQEEYYTDIEPLYLSLGYEEAYRRALNTARSMSWKIVGESKKEGRIEAYDKLPWFGFIDDIVIRVDSVETGSKVDVRSVSRVGKGDLGVNAKRIRAYLDAYKKNRK